MSDYLKVVTFNPGQMMQKLIRQRRKMTGKCPKEGCCYEHCTYVLRKAVTISTGTHLWIHVVHFDGVFLQKDGEGDEEHT